MDYAVFSDEIRHTEGRYYSLAAVSLPAGEVGALTDLFRNATRRRHERHPSVKWSKLTRALGGRGLIEPGTFDPLSGLRSLPFPRPTHLAPGRPWRSAVKVIDPRGNEGLRGLTEDGAT